MSAALLPVPTADGSWTLELTAIGEACHSRAGAWQQARERYAAGCALAELGAQHAGRRPVRLLDVGTGLGLNLAAALEALAPSGAFLEAVGLEASRAVLEAGRALYERDDLRCGSWETWHRPVRRAIEQALEAPAEGAASVELGSRGSLQLRLGDARETLAEDDRGAFDAIFLDPFSPRRAPELWEPGFLARVAGCLAPGGFLTTYSAAFRVRCALAGAGLEVGRGPKVGAKSEGTVAARGRPVPPLSPRVARRLARRIAR